VARIDRARALEPEEPRVPAFGASRGVVDDQRER
jgi:hypothetical protein